MRMLHKKQNYGEHKISLLYMRVKNTEFLIGCAILQYNLYIFEY